MASVATTQPIVPAYLGRPNISALVQKMAGRLVLVAAFTVLMAAARVPQWWLVGCFLLLTSAFPRHRRPILTAAALAWIIVAPPLLLNPLRPDQLDQVVAAHGAQRWLGYWPIVVAGVLLFGLGYTWLTRRFPKSIIGQRPIASMLVLLCALYAAQAYLGGIAWFVVAFAAMIFGSYIWFFAYTATERPKAAGQVPPPRLEFWRPMWSVAKCPVGKGAAYLDQVECKSDEQLAITQLKGFKLLVIAFVLMIVRLFLSHFLFGPYSECQTRLEIPGWSPPGVMPTYNMALEAHLAGNSYAWHIRWLALWSHFFFNVMDLTIFSHKAIGIARMAGFNAFRVTYKPLYATSIADFFNRYHWYLKEMLSTFFFFPTYLRYFKKHPRVRLCFATFAAAGFGNTIYHFLHFDRNIFEYGFWNSLIGYHPYFVYATILSIGICASQLRTLNKKRTPLTGWRKVRAIAGVWIFFCLLSIVEEKHVTLTIGDYASYFISLFRP